MDFVGFKGRRCFSLFSLLGGNGGRTQSPHAGALSLEFASIDGDLEFVVLVVVVDNPDTPEILDTAEFVDSTESRRSDGSEGLRGGRAGESWVGCRFGKGGGIGFGLSTVFWPVRVMTGGGRNPF
jgi:hypothetical protein